MTPKKVNVAFEGVNRLYIYFDDRHDLLPGDVVYVEGKMWRNPGQVQEVTETDFLNENQYNRVLEKVTVEVHGTYYSYGPYMFCFDEEAISFQQFKSWVLPPQRKENSRAAGGFTLALDELGYCDFASEIALELGMGCFEKEQVEFLSLIDGRGQALVNDGTWHTVIFTYDGKNVLNVVCKNEPEIFCEHCIGTCLTLRTLLQVLQNEFSDHCGGKGFTAVNRSLFYKVAAYSLKKITL